MRRGILIAFLLLLRCSVPAFAQTNLILDGGFEAATNSMPWVVSGAYVGVGVNPFAGSSYLAMGNVDGTSESAYQTVTFPTNLIAATLSFHYEVLTSDTAGTDTLSVYILDTNNATIVTNLGSTYNHDPTGYILASYPLATYTGQTNLSSLAGKTVNVFFYAQMDPNYGDLTDFNIDNVSLEAGIPADIPPNDDFTNRTTILGNSATELIGTTYATRETNEPVNAGNAGGHSVWWTWTSTGIGTITITTAGSTFDTLLSVYTGSAFTNLSLVAGDNGFNNASGRASVKFNVLQAGTTYQIALDGYNGQTGTAQLNFNFVPDITPPRVTFASPAAGTVVTNSSVLVKGTATDNVEVAAVYYRLENAAGTTAYMFAPFIGTTTWGVTVTNLIPGPNTVRVEAVDTSSNVSTTMTRVFNYIVKAPLGLTVNGRGTIAASGETAAAHATNGQLLDLGFKYELVATPAAGFAFTNWTGSVNTNKRDLVFMMASNLDFIATFVDVEKPTLNITAPTPGEHWSNDMFNVTGKASDNVGVVTVGYQFNGGAWTTNTLTTNQLANWDVEVPLTSGAHTTSTNTFKAYAEDAAGNRSPTNTVSFFYIESDYLQLSSTGSGSISPNYSNALLQLGRTLTLTAKAGKNNVFSNWTDGSGTVLTNGPVLMFTMASNLDFIANFIPNPYYIAAGNYQGLFFGSGGATPQSSGYFTALVNSNGTFSASFQQGTQSHSLSGQFSVTGSWETNGIKNWSNTAVSLNLDLTGMDVLSGGLTNPAWSAQLASDRNVWSRNNPAPQAGSYTLVLPGTNSVALSVGDGFGAATVNSLGTVNFSVTLGDGTKAIRSTIVTKQGQWPFFVPAGGASGMALGWLTFTNETDRDIDGMVDWFRPSQTAAAFYKGGITNVLEVAGSKYLFTKGARILDLTNGTAVLEGGGLTDNITNQFVLGTNNIATGSDKLTLTFTTSSGLFKGATTNAAGKPVSFTGAVLQKQNAGFGQFPATNQTGSVSLTPD